MKHLFLFLFLALSLPLLAQYPVQPLAKTELGRQTTGDGLIYRGSGAPNYTPVNNRNAWMYYDTINNRLYKSRLGSWSLLVQDTSIFNEIQLPFIVDDTLYLTGAGTGEPLTAYVNRVWPIAALSDTTSITGEQQGDVAFVTDGSSVAFRGALYWNPFSGGGGGGGGICEESCTVADNSVLSVNPGTIFQIGSDLLSGLPAAGDVVVSASDGLGSYAYIAVAPANLGSVGLIIQDASGNGSSIGAAFTGFAMSSSSATTNGAVSISSAGMDFSMSGAPVSFSTTGASQPILINPSGGVRSGSSLTYTTLAKTRPSQNAIWVHNTSGGGAYRPIQNNVQTSITDGSGDMTITLSPAMPSNTYTVIANAQGTTFYQCQPHTLAPGSVKIRVLNAAGAAVTSTSVTVHYLVQEY